MRGVEISIWCLFSLSFVCSSLVLVTIFREKMKSVSSRFIAFLHFAQIMDEIASLPSVFAGNLELCRAVGFFHYYSSFLIVAIGGAIVYILVKTLQDIQQLELASQKWLEIIIFLVPLITLLPFTTNDYGPESYHGVTWCTLQMSSTGIMWSYFILLLWVWLILLGSILVLSVLLYKIHRSFSELTIQVIKCVGIYPIITILAWIPRTIRRITDNQAQVSQSYNLPIYIAGIAYTVVFLVNLDSLRKYEVTRFSSFCSLKSITNSIDDYSLSSKLLSDGTPRY